MVSWGGGKESNGDHPILVRFVIPATMRCDGSATYNTFQLSLAHIPLITSSDLSALSPVTYCHPRQGVTQHSFSTPRRRNPPTTPLQIDSADLPTTRPPTFFVLSPAHYSTELSSIPLGPHHIASVHLSLRAVWKPRLPGSLVMFIIACPRAAPLRFLIPSSRSYPPPPLRLHLPVCWHVLYRHRLRSGIGDFPRDLQQPLDGRLTTGRCILPSMS